jgi:peptidoglycan/xylan/chitin deacetylase (PgdA/CDA1 family)
MEMKIHSRLCLLLTRTAFAIFLLAAMIFVGGCAAQRAAGPGLQHDASEIRGRSFPGFVFVTVQPGDTISSLAAQYLKDPSLDWIISDFNRTESAKAGQELIIPLFQYEKGGLTSEGYQIVPVLSYHKFSLNESDKMTVTKDTFERQMKFLKDNGYRVITLDQLFDFLEFKTQIPRKSVVITIDDGWRSIYEIAYPVLHMYGYPATLFVYTDLITGSYKTLSWDMVRELSENGIDIQQHTKTHRSLAVIGKKESFKEYFDSLEKELTVSAKILKNKTNKEVKYVAYPYGETNRLVIALLKKLGYRGAFTVKRGGSPFFYNNYSINRSMIYGDFDLSEFEESLANFSSEALE